MSEIKQHTIRLPGPLFDHISMRAIAMRRSVNKEIEILLKNALKAVAESDLAATQCGNRPLS